jgi:hypothetical protein
LVPQEIITMSFTKIRVNGKLSGGT